jgi:hypothetical protein
VPNPAEMIQEEVRIRELDWVPGRIKEKDAVEESYILYY